MKRLPLWIEEKGGLEFSCTRCGDCCTGPEGYVWVGPDEVDRLAALLDLARDDFGRRHLRRIVARYALVERSDGDCCFFERGRGCTVYAARPNQCRTFPFWPELVRSESTWSEVTARCPGARAGGRRYAPAGVLALASGQGET